MTPSDASTPFWESVDAPEQVTPLEPVSVQPKEAAPEPVSLGILPAAPVAENTEADAERVPSVDVPEEAFDQEEDELGATLFAAFFLLFFSVFWIGGTAVATVVITGRSQAHCHTLTEYLSYLLALSGEDRLGPGTVGMA